jgi:hypothetical protein
LTAEATSKATGSPSVDRQTRTPWWKKADPSANDLREVVDAVIDATSPVGRATMADIWQERGTSELMVAGGFTALTGELLEHGTADVVLKIAARAVRDEVHHTEIAVAMAARFRGDEPKWPAPQKFPVPRFAPADARLRATLLVIAMCCINETLACGFIEAQLSVAKSPLARAALQTVLSDEIDHARMGWAHLATPFVTTEMKAEIGGTDWLPRLFRAKLSDLLDERAPFPGEEYPEHGILTRRERVELVRTALDDLVLPGFDRAGIDTKNARDWARSALAPWS